MGARGETPLRIVKGSLFRLEIGLLAGDGDDSPLRDLSAHAAEFKVREWVSDAGYVYDSTAAGNSGHVTTSDGSDGVSNIVVNLPVSETGALPWVREGRYALWLVPSDPEDREILLSGPVDIVEEVV